MTDQEYSPGALAYLEQVIAYYEDPANAPHDNPPTPPTAEIAIDVGAACASLIALVLEYQKTGQLPDMEPSMESRLATAELIEQYTTNRRKK